MTKPWPTVRLGEVLTERREIPSDDDLASGKVRIIEKISFDSGRIQLRVDGSTKTGMILVRPGDLVVSGINAAKGAIAIYDANGTAPVAATIHYGAYETNRQRAHVRFLWWMLRSHFFQELLLEYVPGGIKTELKAKRLLPVPVPLPPLSEQRRVVARIEELAAQIHQARTLRHQAAEEADALVLSALKNLRLPGGTVDLPINACSTMSTGTTPPSNRSDYYGGPIQWYTPGDLEYQQQLGASSRTLSEVALAERKARMFEPGTVLLVAIGGSLGKVALTHERCSANQQITGIKFSDEVLPEYGFWWMRRLGKDLMAAAPQATLPIINQERIGVFEISVPPIPEQRRIVSELDALQAEVDALKRLQAGTAAELDALLPAILDRAFKGEL
jgi:type I restriction enzyme S subunit